MATVSETDQGITLTDSRTLWTHNAIAAILLAASVYLFLTPNAFHTNVPMWVIAAFLAVFGIFVGSTAHNEVAEFNTADKKIRIGKKYLWKDTRQEYDFKQVLRVRLQEYFDQSSNSGRSVTYTLYLLFNNGSVETMPQVGGITSGMSVAGHPMGLDNQIVFGQKIATLMNVPFDNAIRQPGIVINLGGARNNPPQIKN